MTNTSYIWGCYHTITNHTIYVHSGTTSTVYFICKSRTNKQGWLLKIDHVSLSVNVQRMFHDILSQKVRVSHAPKQQFGCVLLYHSQLLSFLWFVFCKNVLFVLDLTRAFFLPLTLSWQSSTTPGLKTNTVQSSSVPFLILPNSSSAFSHVTVPYIWSSPTLRSNGWKDKLSKII